MSGDLININSTPVQTFSLNCLVRLAHEVHTPVYMSEWLSVTQCRVVFGWDTEWQTQFRVWWLMNDASLKYLYNVHCNYRSCVSLRPSVVKCVSYPMKRANDSRRTSGNSCVHSPVAGWLASLAAAVLRLSPRDSFASIQRLPVCLPVRAKAL